MNIALRTLSLITHIQYNIHKNFQKHPIYDLIKMEVCIANGCFLNSIKIQVFSNIILSKYT